MNLAYWISRRMRPQGDGAGSSAGAVIAVTGVALALIILEATLAIVVGFKDGIRDKLAGFDAQVTVHAPYDPYTGRQESFVTLSPELENEIRSAFPDAECRLSLRQPGLLKTDSDFEGVIYIGQSPDGDFSFEKSNIIEGYWPDFAQDTCRNMIVISRVVSNSLGLGTGDKVYSTFIVDDNVKLRRHEIAGIYESNFGEYDRTVVYGSLSGLQGVCGIDSLSGSRIDLRGFPMDKIPDAGATLQSKLVESVASGRLQNYYPVVTVMESGAMYFNWLALLDTNVIVVFVLMTCVAGFTLISSLFILILDRVGMIGVLRSLGAGKKLVRDIFVDLAMRLVGIGMVIGNIVGLGLLMIQKYTHIVPLNPEMYYLDSVPVVIEPVYFIGLNVGVVAVAWLVLILPARLASGIDPSATVKYE